MNPTFKHLHLKFPLSTLFQTASKRNIRQRVPKKFFFCFEKKCFVFESRKNHGGKKNSHFFFFSLLIRQLEKSLSLSLSLVNSFF